MLVDFALPKQDTDPPVMEVMADDIPFSKLTIWSDDHDENPAEVMDTLIPPPEVAADIPVINTSETEDSATDMAKADNSTKMH